MFMQANKNSSTIDSENIKSKRSGNSLKERIEEWNELASLLYKLSIGVGVFITFAYLFSIDFFPSNLSPGDVVFFVFVSMSFGFLYVLSLTYGLYASIWIMQTSFYIIRLLRLKDPALRTGNIFALRHAIKKRKKHSGLLFQIMDRGHSVWLRWRIEITKSINSGRGVLPSFAKDGGTVVMSAVVFATMLLIALSIDSSDLNKFLLGFFLAGFVALSIFIAPATKYREKSISSAQRVLLIIILPLLIVFIFGEPKALLHAAFRGLGVRAENVSIEVPDSERAMFDRISETIGRPLIDCRKENNGKLLVHNIDVVWGGIGGQTLLAFSTPGPSKKSEKGKANPKSGKLVKVAIESSAIKIIRSQTAIDACYEIKTDMSFASGRHDLTSNSKTQLINLANAIKLQSTPKEIRVIGYSDPRPISGQLVKKIRDNQYLSEMRARSAGDFLKQQIPGATIITDGAGGGEIRVKCDNSNGRSKYESEQCNRPNRRVDVFVRYYLNN